MEKTAFIKEAAVSLKDKEPAETGAFAAAALDRPAVGTGAGSALVWEAAAGDRTVHCAAGNGREDMSPEESRAMEEEKTPEAEVNAELYGDAWDGEEGQPVRPGRYRISLVDDPTRRKRRQDAADAQRRRTEQAMAPAHAARREVMKVKLDYPVNMAATLAWQYYLKYMC